MVQINAVWAIYLAVLIFTCLNIWILVNRRIHLRIQSGRTRNFRRNCILCNVIGITLICSGAGLFAFVWRSIQQSPALLRPINEMTAQPIQLMAVTLFLAGLTLLMTGISYHRVHAVSPEEK